MSFVLFQVVALGFVVAISLDLGLHLRWGYTAAELLGAVGLTVAGALLYGLCLMLFEAIGFSEKCAGD